MEVLKLALTPKQWRLVKEMSQEEVATALKVSIPTYRSMELNPSEISFSNGRKLATIFDVDICDIDFFAEERNKM